MLANPTRTLFFKGKPWTSPSEKVDGSMDSLKMSHSVIKSACNGLIQSAFQAIGGE